MRYERTSLDERSKTTTRAGRAVPTTARRLRKLLAGNASGQE